MSKRNQGMSLAEIMVGLGLFSVVTYQFLGGSNFLRQFSQETEESVAIENIVKSIYDNVSTNIGLFKVSYDPEEFFSAVSAGELEKRLDYAWSRDVFVAKDKCTDCPGRLGYVVVPVPQYRGLYRLVIRVTHKEKIDGFRDYTYLISGR